MGDRKEGAVTALGCDHRQRSVGRFLEAEGSRPATSIMCRGVGLVCPGVDLNAMCHGLSLLTSLKRVGGLSSFTKTSRFSKQARERYRFVYAEYRQVVSLRDRKVRRVVRLTNRGFKKGVASCDTEFFNLYRSYLGRTRNGSSDSG